MRKFLFTGCLALFAASLLSLIEAPAHAKTFALFEVADVVYLGDTALIGIEAVAEFKATVGTDCVSARVDAAEALQRTASVHQVEVMGEARIADLVRVRGPPGIT